MSGAAAAACRMSAMSTGSRKVSKPAARRISAIAPANSCCALFNSCMLGAASRALQVQFGQACPGSAETAGAQATGRGLMPLQIDLDQIEAFLQPLLQPLFHRHASTAA